MIAIKFLRYLAFAMMVGGVCAQNTQINTAARFTEEQTKSLEAGNARLTCGLSCAFSYGMSNRKLKLLHDTENWDELIYEIINIGHEKNIAYYYLGRSFEEKGNLDAAEKYYKLGLASNKCAGNICNGLLFPDEIDKRLLGLQKSRSVASNPLLKPKTELMLPSGWVEKPLPIELKNVGAEFWAMNASIQAAVRYWTLDKVGLVNVPAYIKKMPQVVASDLTGAIVGEIQELEVNGNKAYRFEVTGSPKNQAIPFTFLITFVEGSKYLVRTDALIAAKDYADFKDHLGKLAYGLKSDDLKNVGYGSQPLANPNSELAKTRIEAQEFRPPNVSQRREERVALVIGNSAYKTSPLRNPVNDARDMANSLRGYGFTVIERNNLTVKQIGSTLREFRSKLTPGSVALVFYAGHGLQIKGENYLTAVDADIDGEEDVPNQSLSTRQIMDVLADAKSKLNLVFLDACRDNPYSRSFRSASRGLGRENAPSGTLISFATRPGSIAADGDGRNGLYTSVLLQQMKTIDQPIEQVLKRVVTGVKTASNGKQEPWMEGSIEGDFCFGQCGVLAQNSSPSVPLREEKKDPEEEAWNAATRTNTFSAFQAYLNLYPNGRYKAAAQIAMSAVDKTSQSSQVVSSSLLSSNAQITNIDIANKAFVGTWANGDCERATQKTRYKLSGDELSGEFSDSNNLISTSTIKLNSIKVLDSVDGRYKFSYFLTTKPKDSLEINKFQLITESDFQSRRTIESIKEGAGYLIRDGLFMGNLTPTPTQVKCKS